MNSDSRPDWVADAVFYQIFPDRFARSERVPKPANLEPWHAAPTPHGYKGGDLLGVVEHLDWIQDLGVTALYLNPIFRSTSNHRYHTHDYYRVDPLLGGDEAFAELLDRCHHRGIRVVLDGVFNHSGRGFFRFNDVLENGAASPWVDWFRFDGHPINAYDHSRPPGYSAWWGLHALPKLNTDNPEVREYLMQVAEHWIRRGIDGWRFDVPAEITTRGFWEEMRRRVRTINPGAYLVGEIWDDATDWIGHDPRFDGVMNYPMTEVNIRFAAAGRVDAEVAEPVNLDLDEPLDGAGYAAAVAEHLGRYPDAADRSNLNLLGSHDTARIRSLVGDDEASVVLAAVLMFTFPGAPCVYYGDEVGLTGRHDPGCRAGFPWESPGAWNQHVLEAYRSLIALRHAEPSLRRGEYRTLESADSLHVFARTLPGDATIVAINPGDDSVTSADLPLDPGDRVWGPGAADGRAVTVPARSATVWKAQG